MTQQYNNQDAGNAPSGPLPSDQEIQRGIENRIIQEKYLHEEDLKVNVNHGMVTLAGVLPSPMARELLIDLVQGVHGVQDINVDQLTVGDVPPVNPGIGGGPTREDNPTTSSDAENVGVTVDEILPVGIPVTSEEIKQMDAETVTAMKATHDATTEDRLAAALKTGMDVVDRDGHKVGKVKEVRPTDFRLARGLLEKDLYVPYAMCDLDAGTVVLEVLKDEVSKQGWAVPGETDTGF